MSDVKTIEQFVLAHNGGVLLPMSVPKVCELLLAWNNQMANDSPFVPSEWRCPRCNYRAGQVQACPIDGSSMQPVTWKEACLTASRIASRARKRCEVLVDAWPDGHAIPVGEEDENPSIEEKIERLREAGLYDIAFRNAGVGLMFFSPPADFVYPEFAMGMTQVERDERERSWRKYLVVEKYYESFDEAIESEYLKRKE